MGFVKNGIWLIALVLVPATGLGQGDLMPDSAPAPTQKSLQEIYDRIDMTLVALLQGQGVDFPVLYEEGITNVVDSVVSSVEPSLAFTPDGLPAVAFHNDRTDELWYAVRMDDEWKAEVVDRSTGVNEDDGNDPDLFFTPSGYPSIVSISYSQSYHQVKYYIKTGSTWETNVIESGYRYSNPSLAYDHDERPLVAYNRRQGSYTYGFTNELVFATVVQIFGIPSWVPSTISSFTNFNVHDYSPSIAVDPATGNAIIAAHDRSDDAIVLKVRSNGRWSTGYVVTGLSGVQIDLSLAFGINQMPALAISRYDTSLHRFTLYYAERSRSGSWTETVVDDTSNFEHSISMAITPFGQPMISYMDFENGRLKLARRLNGVWTTEAVDTLTSVGWKSDLAISPAGLPAVIYMDAQLDRMLFYQEKVPDAP